MSDEKKSAENEKMKFLSIGKTATLLGLSPSVLRYWEKEFPQLTPLKTDYGHRKYTPDQIEVLGKIKTLLYEEGMTIRGARNALFKAEEKQKEETDSVKEMKNKINDLLSIIRKEKQE